MIYLNVPICFSSNKIIEKNVVTNERGEFWRLLRPGTYRIKARHQNMESEAVQVNVDENNVKMIDLMLSQQVENASIDRLTSVEPAQNSASGIANIFGTMATQTCNLVPFCSSVFG